MSKYILSVMNDEDAECPNEDCGWTLYDRRSKRSWRAFTLSEEEIKDKVDAGLLYFLDYFEHGNCVWSIHGEGPQCDFDNSQFAGVLLWTDHDWAPDQDKREADAEGFLETYTNWSNGAVYGYQLCCQCECSECGVTHKGEEIDSCWGFYEAEDIASNIRGYFEAGDTLEIIGDAKWLMDGVTLVP